MWRKEFAGFSYGLRPDVAVRSVDLGRRTLGPPVLRLASPLDPVAVRDAAAAAEVAIPVVEDLVW